MKFSFFGSLLLAMICVLTSWVISPDVIAATPIRLFDISYQECSGELAEGNVSSGGGSVPVNCFIVFGKAENKSGKMVVDADVFGRIYDANHNSVLENRGRVGSIAEIPPGVSDFSIRISVPADQPTPLILEQFKASGFGAKVRPYYYDEED